MKIIDKINNENIVQIIFEPAGDWLERQFVFTVDKRTGKAIVEAPYIQRMNYGYSKEKNWYRVYTGTIDEIMKQYKTPIEFLSTF